MTTFDGRLYWVLSDDDRGEPFGPRQDRQRAEDYARNTGGRLFSIAVTLESERPELAESRKDGGR